MARTSEQVTQQEIQAYVDWCAAHGVKNVDGSEDALNNAQVVADYFLETWKQDFNRQNLDLALPMIRHLLKFHGPAEATYHRHIAKIGPEQAKIISDMIYSRGLNTDGDNLFINFNAIAAYLTEKRHPISIESVDRALGNIVNSKRPLIWQVRLQDSEKEALKNRQEQQPAQARPVDEVKIPAGLPAYLHSHYLATHRPQPDETKKTQESQESLDAEWRQRAVDAVNSITFSNLDREEASQFLKKSWPAELIYRSIISFISRRKNERWNVGR